VTERNLQNAQLQYGIGNYDSNIMVPFNINPSSQTQTGNVTVGGLQPGSYQYRLVVTDLAGHQTTATGSQNVEIASVGGTAGFVFTPPASVAFSNSGQISASGTVTVTIKHDRPNNLSDINAVGVSFNDEFGGVDASLSGSRIGAFSGVLAGNSCASVQYIPDFGRKSILCHLQTPIDVQQDDVAILSFSGITNPAQAGKYPFEARFITDHDEFYFGEANVRDVNDDTAPTIHEVIVPDAQSVEFIFDEPIEFAVTEANSGSVSNGAIGQDAVSIAGLQTFGSVVDYNDRSRLRVFTETQTGGTTYEYTLSGIVDLNLNAISTLTGSFLGFDTSTKRLDHIGPDHLVQGQSMIVDVFGSNDIFSGSVSSVSFGTGVSVATVTPIDANHITAQVTIAGDAVVGPRPLSLSVGGVPYKKLNALYVDQNFNNLAQFFGVFPGDFDANASTGVVDIDFNAPILSIGNPEITRVYGSGATPTIASSSASGSRLTLNLANVAVGANYDIILSDTTFSDKNLGDPIRVGFSFFDPSAGFGSINLPPIVINSLPSENMSDVPVKDPTGTGITLVAYFDQPLQSSSVSSTTVTLVDDDNNAVAGTVAYSTGATGNAADGKEYKIAFTTSAALANAKGYSLTFSHALKSDKGLGLVGNIPPSRGYGYALHFVTKGNFSSAPSGTGSTAAGGTASAFMVEKSSPFPGATSVPYDAKLRVAFTDTIDTSTIGSSTVWLKRTDASGNTFFADVPVSYSYDDSFAPRTVILDAGTLAHSATGATYYRLEVRQDVKSIRGQSLPGHYTVIFSVGNTAAASVPFVLRNDFAPDDLSSIELHMESPVDPSTVNSSNISLFATGGIKISTDVQYDAGGNTIFVRPLTQPTSDTDYTLVVKPTKVKNIMGNGISTGATMLPPGFAYIDSSLQKTYRAGTVDFSTNSLFVENFFANANSIALDFPRDISSPTSKSNYSLRYCLMSAGEMPQDCVQSRFISYALTDATVKYSAPDSRVEISGFSIPSGTGGTLVQLQLNNVSDSFGNALPTCSSGPEFVSEIAGCRGRDLFEMMMASETVGTHFQASTMAIALSARVQPQNNVAGRRTSYFVDMPIKTALASSSTIEVVFPKEFSLSGAELDGRSPANFSDANFTQPRFSLSADDRKKIITVTLTGNTSFPASSFVHFDILGIANPDVAKDFSTSGYIATIQTKNGSGMILDRFDAEPIFIRSAPSGSNAKTITINFKSGSTIEPIENAVVRINGPDGSIEALSSGGTVVFTGSLGSRYNVQVDPSVQTKSGSLYLPSGYLSDGRFYDVLLDNNKTIDIAVKNLSTGVGLVSVSGTVSGLAGKSPATLFIASSQGYFEFDLGAIAMSPYTLTGIKVPQNLGYATIGLMPTMPKGTAASTTFTPDWQPPRPLQMNIGTGTLSGVSFSVATADIPLTIAVVDQSGKAVPKANVSIYAPGGQSLPLFGETDSTGNKTFMVRSGVYNYNAVIQGVSSPEKTVSLSAATTVTLRILIPDYSVSGKVLNGSDTVSNADVNAFNETTGQFVATRTDTSGAYLLRVGAGTWKVRGFVPGFGPLAEQTVILSGASITNQNFTIDTSSLVGVSGTVSVNSVDISGANIFAEPSDFDRTKAAFAFTESDGTYSLSLQPGAYRLRAYHPQYGEIGSTTEFTVIDSTPITGKNITVGNTHSVTIAFTGAGVPTTSAGLEKFEWMVDVFDPSARKGFSRSVKSQTGFVFDNVPEGTFGLRVSIRGIGPVYSSDAFIVDGDEILSIPVSGNNTLVTVSGSVTQSGTVTSISDAFVEIRNTTTKQVYGEKTGTGGTFSVLVPRNVSIEYIVKKPGYLPSDVMTGSTGTGGLSIGTVRLVSFSTGSTITLT